MANLDLQLIQKALIICLVWDDFSAHGSARVCQLLEQKNVVMAAVTKNMTHIFAPLNFDS